MLWTPWSVKMAARHYGTGCRLITDRVEGLISEARGQSPDTKHSTVRDWSLITGTGGLQNGRGGHVKFYPYAKRGRKEF